MKVHGQSFSTNFQLLSQWSLLLINVKKDNHTDSTAFYPVCFLCPLIESKREKEAKKIQNF